MKTPPTGSETPALAANKKFPLEERFAGLALGILTLLWTRLEDTGIINPLILSLLWSVWCAIVLRRSDPPFQVWRASLWGAGAGLAVTPLAYLLVAIKAGLHQHGFADLTPSQLKRVAAFTPWWVIAGALLVPAANLFFQNGEPPNSSPDSPQT